MHGFAYRWAKFAYSNLRMVKNRTLNLLDRPVVVLIYHRVTTLASDPQLLAVTPSNFRAQMQYLKDNFPVLRFEDDWSRVEKPAVVVTFDDGYADNALEALPILEEVGVPATFFIIAGTIDIRQEFWSDELERIVLGDWNFSEQFELADSRFGRAWPTVTEVERYKLYEEIHPFMKKVDPQRRENWLMQLRQWAHAAEGFRETHRAMTVDELGRLARSRWATIGAHTVTHTPLSSLPVQMQREEVIRSKMQLETWLEREIKVFSYPFGTKRDYTRESAALCKEAGYVKAAANFPGQAHRWTDPYEIPRQLVRNWDLSTFTKNLKKFWVL